jgi:hypothetical protein
MLPTIYKSLIICVYCHLTLLATALSKNSAWLMLKHNPSMFLTQMCRSSSTCLYQFPQEKRAIYGPYFTYLSLRFTDVLQKSTYCPGPIKATPIAKAISTRLCSKPPEVAQYPCFPCTVKIAISIVITINAAPNP